MRRRIVCRHKRVPANVCAREWRLDRRERADAATNAAVGEAKPRRFLPPVKKRRATGARSRTKLQRSSGSGRAMTGLPAVHEPVNRGQPVSKPSDPAYCRVPALIASANRLM